MKAYGFGYAKITGRVARTERFSGLSLVSFFNTNNQNMSDLPKNIEELQQAVEHLHNCKAEYVESEHVEDVFQGETVWTGEVATFVLTDHPTATQAFAWKEKNEETGKSRFFAVLNVEPVTSPQAAVRASIMRDVRMSAN